MRMLLSIAALGIAAELAAETAPFERYQPLIDRYPFGRPPANFDPQRMSSEVSKNGNEEAELAEEQAQIVKNVSFSVINLESDGSVMVGFSDNTDPKQPHHYYLKAGESRNGWTVKAADAAAKTMTLSKDGVDVELSLGDKSGGGKTPSSPQKMTSPAQHGKATTESQPLVSSFKSHRAKREREVEKMKADIEAARRKEEADRKAREEERLVREEERDEQRRQLEAIREELRRNREEKAAAARAASIAEEEKPDETN